MDVEEATAEFLTWGLYPQVDVLSALDTFTAAAILGRVDPALRKELLSMLEPGVAANIVQVGRGCLTRFRGDSCVWGLVVCITKHTAVAERVTAAGRSHASIRFSCYRSNCPPPDHAPPAGG
jgi:hypothetical protein